MIKFQDIKHPLIYLFINYGIVCGLLNGYFCLKNGARLEYLAPRLGRGVDYATPVTAINSAAATDKITVN